MTEQHEPEKINPGYLGDYLEVMSKAIFQAGISWRVVESKWPGIRMLFGGSMQKPSPISPSRSWMH